MGRGRGLIRLKSLEAIAMIKKLFPAVFSGASALALAAVLTVTGSHEAQACDADTPYIGTVCYLAGNFCPEGYLPADGRLVNINTYNALYSLVSITYGGDAKTTFGLPDMRGRTPIGWGASTPLTSTIQFGTKRGAETATLNGTQLPGHTHPATFTGTGGGAGSPLAVTVPVGTGNGTVSTVTNGQSVYLSGAAINNQNPDPVTLSGPYATATPATTGKLAGVTATGGGGGITGGTVAVGSNNPNTPTPVSIVSPQQALTACIAVLGIYPTRP
jgi:microcystin-dependent protein